MAERDPNIVYSGSAVASKLVNFVFTLRRTPPNMRRRSDAAATDFCVLRDYFRHELRRIGDGARVGLLLWRSWIDRSASQPPDGIAGQSPQS